MPVTITGQITNGAGANQLVTATPFLWPITNPSGASATDPGITQALCIADGSWSLTGLTNRASYTITTPEGTSAGQTPAADGTYSLSSLQGSGWSQGGAH